MKTIPDTIYLQVLDEDGDEPDEITWCVDKIHDTDIEYVRAGIVKIMRVAYDELRDKVDGLAGEREAYRLSFFELLKERDQCLIVIKKLVDEAERILLAPQQDLPEQGEYPHLAHAIENAKTLIDEY